MFLQVKQVYAVINSFCLRAVYSMRNSCMDSAIGADHKLLSQSPIANYLQNFGGMSSSDEQNAYLWFIGFVYRLRNALFHEIIDPLDLSWQLVFKNAYLVLKQVVDANINRLKTAAQLLERAPIVYREEFAKAPPPEIPIEEHDNTNFSYDNILLESYNQDGAKVHINSTWSSVKKKHKIK